MKVRIFSFLHYPNIHQGNFHWNLMFSFESIDSAYFAVSIFLSITPNFVIYLFKLFLPFLFFMYRKKQLNNYIYSFYHNNNLKLITLQQTSVLIDMKELLSQILSYN